MFSLSAWVAHNQAVKELFPGIPTILVRRIISELYLRTHLHILAPSNNYTDEYRRRVIHPYSIESNEKVCEIFSMAENHDFVNLKKSYPLVHTFMCQDGILLSYIPHIYI